MAVFLPLIIFLMSKRSVQWEVGVFSSDTETSQIFSCRNKTSTPQSLCFMWHNWFLNHNRSSCRAVTVNFQRFWLLTGLFLNPIWYQENWYQIICREGKPTRTLTLQRLLGVLTYAKIWAVNERRLSLHFPNVLMLADICLKTPE